MSFFFLQIYDFIISENIWIFYHKFTILISEILSFFIEILPPSPTSVRVLIRRIKE